MIRLKSLICEAEEELYRLGEDPNEVKSETPIVWDKPDIQMNSKWTIPVIRKFMGLKPSFGEIYPAILDVSDLDYDLAEEDPELPDEERGGYDWDEFRMFGYRGVPPIVVVREENGKVKLADGNHRLKWASEAGFRTIGAWVVDKLIQKAIDKKR